ncbi:hypothetical protein K458DRAFT_376713 [Lentithecium fluviatile CBS 122367]|uniref:RING-type domain-containing protein n=1 Tax=Lentithecium fluviatile CBS 122367 TaxID=1168545 RepID=A0A6G1IKD9_9PLEO|nr:hypothetical protein K458DRAFT_376713 [Lentithecium fluviatile CBS 122367]
MPESMLSRWQLTCALLATVQVASASIEASNKSTTEFDYAGQLILQSSDGNNLTELVPLSMDAAQRTIDGVLYLATDSTYNNISDGEIAYISCDDNDYKGNIQANDVLQNVYSKADIQGAIFYSTWSSSCVYADVTAQLQSFPMYSMNSTSDSQKVLDQLSDRSTSAQFSVQVARAGSTNNHDGQQTTQNGQGQNNPLGPSPSTAVAMIILYSITGIITALFLVIIVTGAVRAHRHPDRYGPRDVLGRPRQSRARGLGRAILDTIPIVKFGQTEPPKPADVELGSTSEARAVNTTNAETDTPNAQPGTTETREVPTIETPPNTTAEPHAGMESGISAAQPVVVGAAATHTDPSDGGLGCSICTEDFEKGQDIRVLPCNHKFHPDCVDPWLLNVSGTCPLCRVDLRPVNSHSSADEDGGDPDHLAPPLQSDTDVSHRRRSVMRDILSFRSRPEASADERISALRRLREQRAAMRSLEGVNAAAGAEDVARRRSRRISTRLSGVFGGRRRGGREDSPAAGESEGSVTRRDEADPSNEPTRPAEDRDQR